MHIFTELRQASRIQNEARALGRFGTSITISANSAAGTNHYLDD